MTFLIDAHHLGLRQTGNETWVRNVVAAIESDRHDVHYAIVPAGVRELPASVEAHRQHLVGARSLDRLLRDLPRAARRLKAESYLVQYTVAATRRPAAVMIHDLSFEDPSARSFLNTSSLLRYRATIRASSKVAKTILVPSEFTRGVLLERYPVDPSKVYVSCNALDPVLNEALMAAPRRPNPEAPVVLCVGNVLPRKNLLIVAQAVAQLRKAGSAARLVIAGSVPVAGQAMAEQVRTELGEHVTFTGHVSTEELAQAYRSADAFCFPSLYEGFGIPILEAMAAGVPVVASTATSLPEVGGDAALYADPTDLQVWVSALESVLSDSEAAKRHSEAGYLRVQDFRWQDAADAVLAALAAAAA